MYLELKKNYNRIKYNLLLINNILFSCNPDKSIENISRN